MLKGISENRNKTSLSDRELRNLLLDAKPHRSKWANDDKIGQEDLYEACEKVLTDLKNYTVCFEKKNECLLYPRVFFSFVGAFYTVS